MIASPLISRSLVPRRLLRGRGSLLIPRSNITATHLATSSSTTDGTSFVATSVSPAANALLLMWWAGHTAGTPAAPTLTGYGLTWTAVGSQSIGSVRRISLYWARTGNTAPAAGSVTADFGATTQTAVVWSLSQFFGVDKANPFVGGASVATGAAITTLQSSMTLEHSRNVHASGLCIAANAAITQDTDFTQLGQDGEAATVIAMASGFAIGQAACDWTFSSTTAGLVSAQLRAA